MEVDIERLGCRKDPPDRRDYPARMRLPRRKVIVPEHFSRRGEMTSIKSQGRAPTCAGFAITALKEWQELQQRAFTAFEDSSEMWVYWKAKERDRWPGEPGTSIRAGLKVLSQLGETVERGWPYTDEVAPGHKPPTGPQWWAYGVAHLWGKVGSYYRLESLGEVKEWIYLHGPVVAGMAVGRSAFRPVEHEGADGGFVELPGEILGGHAVAFTGWDERYEILQFKNSWGTWGDRGYGYISEEYFVKHVWDVWAVLDE